MEAIVNINKIPTSNEAESIIKQLAQMGKNHLVKAL